MQFNKVIFTTSSFPTFDHTHAQDACIITHVTWADDGRPQKATAHIQGDLESNCFFF